MTDREQGGARERLFLAAVRVFGAKGYKGATVRDICREAGGANLNAINYYFGGKKKLYQAILEVIFTEGERRIRERLAEAGELSPPERLRLYLEECGRLYFAEAEATAAFMRVWLMELANPSPFFVEMVERHSRPQIEVLLQDLSSILGREVPGETQIDCLMCIVGPLVYQALLRPIMKPMFPNHPDLGDTWPRLVEHLYRFVMAGLRGLGGGPEERPL
jgi:AcrR family transcriptional regulator